MSSHSSPLSQPQSLIASHSHIFHSLKASPTLLLQVSCSFISCFHAAGDEFNTLGMLGNCSTTELHPQTCTPSNLLPVLHSYLFSLFLECLQCKAGVTLILQRKKKKKDKTMVKGACELSQSHRGEFCEEHGIPLIWA